MSTKKTPHDLVNYAASAQWAAEEIRKEKEEAKPPTCLNCRFWSMWDHHCTMQALGADNWQPVHPDTPACSEFQPE